MERERIATWWMKWNDLDWPSEDNLDRIKRRAEGFAKADVTAAMFFGAHFRWDFLPVFPLLHDYIATVAEELHKVGVKLYEHHSVDLVHRYSTREEMRHVMLHSGPHLPFSPSFEAAASWRYKGKLLNDWRMVDVRTGNPLWLGQYAAECFCPNNPEFREAYFDYVKTLIADTGIDGLSADDPGHFQGYNSCGCEHCRAELKKRTGIELPPADDQSFWGNWDNPAWLAWSDLRLDMPARFYRELKSTLPEGFMLTGCGGASASAVATCCASDAHKYAEGCNYINMEMVGNTPPYKKDPLTVNTPFVDRMVSASHHQATARAKGLTAFNTGFAHTPESANLVWAVSKVLEADAWVGTLKSRLGLPQRILDTLPCEEDIVGTAFGFEKKHPELFNGRFVGQLGVYFSEETRTHTLSGSQFKGYPKDYSTALTLLFRAGVCPHTVFAFPEDAKTYPVILLCSAAKMRPDETEAMNRYLQAGGKVIVSGPTPIADCKNSWQIPNRVGCAAKDLFVEVPDGIHRETPAWQLEELPPCTDPDEWQQPREGLYYNPHRISEEKTGRETLEMCMQFMKPLPVEVKQAKGYLTTMFETEGGIAVHFLAEDYDAEVDPELDAMRYHRSRVNYITKVAPAGVDGCIRMKAQHVPQVFTPFQNEPAQISLQDGECTIRLPENCSYAIVLFPN